MSKDKNLVEEAIIQMKNLEEAVAENAKGILASTMGQEIKELVKESLEESENDEQEEVDTTDVEVDTDDESSDEEDTEPMDMDTDKSTDSEEVVDLRGQPNSQVLKVFQLMDDNDEVVVTKDDAENIHLKDGQKEYMIVQEGEEDTYESDNMETNMYEMDDMDDEESFDFEKADMGSDSDIEKIVADVFGSEGSIEEDTYEQDMQENKYEGMGDAFVDEDEIMYEIEMDEETDEQDMTEDMDEEDMDEEEMYEQSMDEEDMDEEDMNETVYEIEMDEETDEQDMTEDMDEEDMDEETDEQDMTEDMDEDMYEQSMDEDMYEQSMDEDMYEQSMDEEDMDEDDMEEGMETSALAMESKMTTKPKGVGMGSPKFKYSSKPNTEGGFKVIKKKADKTMGTGKAKFEYKEGKNMNGKMKPVKKGLKKMETKEASRTLGAGRFFGKKGLPKPKAAPRHLRVESINNEVSVLREKNEEYRKALNVFRSKLNEVAVFNSNLAYATRLFTEHTTSKQEKINILRRFDGVESLRESKNLYKTIKDELSNSTSQPMNESFERIVENTQASGSVNLIESKTYENPQFLRMKDLMNKIK